MLDLKRQMEALQAEISAYRVDLGQIEGTLKRDSNKRKALLSAVGTAEDLRNTRARMHRTMERELRSSTANDKVHKGLNSYFVTIDSAALHSAALLLAQAETDYQTAKTRADIGVQTKCMSADIRYNLQRQINALKAEISERLELIDRIARHVLAGTLPDSLATMQANAERKADRLERKENKKQAKYLKNLEKRLSKTPITVPASTLLHTPNVFKRGDYDTNNARVMHGTHGN